MTCRHEAKIDLANERLPPTRAAAFWTNLRYQLTFNSFIRPGNILRLLPHLCDVSPRYWPRALLLTTMSVLVLPLRYAEHLRFGRQISRTPIAESPIFIIGHWRSGTTHLHNLFSQDAALGWVSMYQAIAPDFSLIGGNWLRRLLAWVLPAHRPMDNMVWPVTAPQEEEVALGKTTAYSFYAQFMFPREAGAFFKRHVLLENASPRIASELQARYRQVLKIATIHAGGRRLVLKNPVNTARLGMLVEMFPDAKFVHIHRSPYEVYASTLNLHRRITVFTTLQTLDMRHEADSVFELYEGMMRRFLADRPIIAPGNIAEVRFEDLERDPIGEMRRLYQELSLPGFAATEPGLRAYVASQATYRKNTFSLSDVERETINERWGFAFEALGYRMRRPGQDAAPAERRALISA
jgi:omega-hydroxy-beta-dihydromenaquinone-9 sulfotransferase